MTPLSKQELRNYGILALPLAVAGLPLYLHVPDFYVTEKGISLSIIGLVLVLVRFIDAIQDPLIGALLDHYSRWRRPVMLTAVGGLGLGMLALFVPPGDVGITWFAAFVIVSTSCYSIVTINLNTIGGIWSKDLFERTRISSAREGFGLIGVTIGVLVPGILSAIYGKTLAFALFAGILLVLLAYCGWRFRVWSLENRALVEGKANRERLLSNLSIPKDSRVRRLVLVTFIGALASSLPAVLFLIFVRDRLGGESIAWLFLLIYFASAIAGIPIWRNLSQRAGKVRAWCLSIAFALMAFVGAAFAGSSDFILYGIVCLLTGFALGGDLVFPASLMADLLGDDEKGQTHATSGYAWLSFVQKAGLGLAAGLAFGVLGWLNFSTGEQNGSLALAGLVCLYAVLPLVLKLGAALLLWGWRNHFEERQSYENKINTNRNRAPDLELDSNWMQKPYEN